MSPVESLDSVNGRFNSMTDDSMTNEGLAENENNSEREADSLVDAICIVVLTLIAITTAVYWVSTQ